MNVQHYFQSRQYVIACPATAIVVTQKLNERSRNVYENKRPAWKTGGYPGISLKTKYLAIQCGNLLENKGG
jgi:hypothetical protein